MKNRILAAILFVLLSFTPVFALEVIIVPTDPANGKTLEQNATGAVLSRKDMFSLASDLSSENLKESYTYIELFFTDVKKGTPEYSMLQKLVYLGLLDNAQGKVYLQKPVTGYYFYNYIEKIVGSEIVPETEKITKTLRNRYANVYDIEKVKLELAEGEGIQEIESAEIIEKKDIFNDVYNTLSDSHYDKENLDHKKMIYTAIEGLAQGTGDKHTVYFPPIKNKSFEEGLAGEFEGIGAYVDMKQPGVLSVISPITDAPAQKAGIKAGDIIIKVGVNEVTKDTGLHEAISWIKGPAGSSVNLEILRGEEVLKFSVVREKIIVKDVETEIIDDTTLYVKMKNFGIHASEDFTSLIGAEKGNRNIDTIIFDLRNNPGGYLNVVNDILGNFVPAGEPVSIIKYRDYTITNKSRGQDLLDFSKYKIVVIQNGGTASASEIMIGTLRDYYDDITVIGENSYGKGSVQTIKGYIDGSSLKYTVAKWFTGKSQTGIDGIGIIPDIEVKFDDEAYKSKEFDNQLEKALDL